LRVLVDPRPGKAICELDYGSQEVFIAGSVSGDENMKNAYQSNDVYMFYAQLTGMYPADLPIPTEDQRSEDWFKPHKKTRSIAKTLNLSMQFGAGAKSVAAAVRDATKDTSIPDEQGAEWVAQYREAYSDYTWHSKQLRDLYNRGISLRLPSGWRMGRDNPSSLSAGNIPVQGPGSDILRVACRLVDEAGLTGVATLHDALTLECDELDCEAVGTKATELMKQAAEIVLGEPGMKVGHPEIVRHGELWLHSERAQAAWAKLSEHFTGTS
jgi:DNA polymerase I-like protein with 3'-5' exonuclease and polymerase domains